MKLNHLMAAVAFLAAGAANAALDRPNTGNGSLFLTAYDNIGSPVGITVDLGINVDNFRTFDDVNFAYLSKDGLGAGYHKIVWDFANNTVTTSTPNTAVNGFDPTAFVPTSTTTGALVAGITGNAWSAAFNQFATLAQASDVRWAVGAADIGNNFFASTGSNVANLNSLSTADAVNFGLTDQGLYSATNLAGTHPTANNGANLVIGTAQPSPIEPSMWGTADGWLGNSNFGATTAAGVTQNNFFLLDENNLTRTVVGGDVFGATNSASLLNNLPTWTYDHVNKTLTYETAAVVPEPESYALVIAGLATLVTVARRRRQG